MVVIGTAFTYDDLCQMPDDGKRYEILEGELAVSPSPKTKHQRVVKRMVAFLSRAQDAGFGEAFVAPLDVVFDAHNVTEPDAFFISTERSAIVTEDNIQGAPDLVVEVLSGSTRGRDVGAKLRIYARHRVAHYWVVDPDAQTVQPYEWQENGYREKGLLRVGDLLTCPLFPTVSTDVAALFG